MAIEIVTFPAENDDVPWFLYVYQRVNFVGKTTDSSCFPFPDIPSRRPPGHVASLQTPEAGRVTSMGYKVSEPVGGM